MRDIRADIPAVDRLAVHIRAADIPTDLERSKFIMESVNKVNRGEAMP